jgi:phosphatidylserine/phosphatidylglycerophosphate/cardiolipin synthase-like enzyme
MKKLCLLISLLLAGNFAIEAQENIAAARALGVGAEVTVTGIVTNGDELGLIRYLQDATGGIAAYSSLLSDVQRGDEVTVTGTLKDYNTLLEIDPVSSVTVNSTGNPSPDPVVLTPAQLSEQYEGMLVKINNVDFDASGTFERNSYTFMADGEAGQIYVNSFDSPLIGMVIPTNPVSLVGPLGAYGGTYQLLPRDQFDILSSSVINLTSVPLLSNLSTTGFTVSWTTDVTGTTEAFYGNTPEMELGKLLEDGTTTTHAIDLAGLAPSELIYLQPFSVKDQDTIKAAVQVYLTQSESTGDVKAYFNRPVDNSVSLGLLEAKYLDHAIDDTLINYINRAEESIDFTIYNFNNNGISNLSDALNAAHDRGVTVRVIYDSNIDAVGVESLDAAIGRIASPKSEFPLYGIMHNKFIVFDANSDDPDKPVVWTGATNFTDGQINTDPNNVIVVQDKSLAKAFQLEFNEMFGSDGAQPDAARAKFGPDKTDNTPHEFIIGGSRVECYFSPSDGTHNQILNTIATADHSIHIATMLITKTDIGYDLSEKNDAGVDVKVLINDFDQYGEPIVEELKSSLEDDIRVTGEPGIMHHKYMIVDQGHADSDPILLTGSHNWSSSAQFRNDENTLIFHSQAVANAYYQEFVQRFSFGELVVPKPELKNDFVTMNGGSSFRYDVLYNDNLPGAVNLSISSQPTNGSAKVETDKTITYTPDPGFNQDIDTVVYRVCLVNTSICDSALFVIYVNRPASVTELGLDRYVSVYPVPASDQLSITAAEGRILRNIAMYDQSGRETFHSSQQIGSEFVFSVRDFEPGLYYLRMELDEGVVNRKIIIQ